MEERKGEYFAIFEKDNGLLLTTGDSSADPFSTSTYAEITKHVT